MGVRSTPGVDGGYRLACVARATRAAALGRGRGRRQRRRRRQWEVVETVEGTAVSRDVAAVNRVWPNRPSPVPRPAVALPQHAVPGDSLGNPWGQHSIGRTIARWEVQKFALPIPQCLALSSSLNVWAKKIKIAQFNSSGSSQHNCEHFIVAFPIVSMEIRIRVERLRRIHEAGKIMPIPTILIRTHQIW